MKRWQCPPVNKVVKNPIEFWQAIQCKKVIDEHANIAILKSRNAHLKGVTYQPKK